MATISSARAETSQRLALPILLFISLSLMKFRIMGVPLSDLLVVACVVLFFLRYCSIEFTVQSISFLCFCILALTLSVLVGGAESAISSAKLFVPLLALVTANSLFQHLNEQTLLKLTARILFFLIASQLVLVLLFYSQLFSFLFHLVEPGNVNRELAGFRINVYMVPFLGINRFGSVFVEPSWYAFFTGFFLLLWFYQIRRQTAVNIKLWQDAGIILALVVTLSFTGFVFLFVAYIYRFIDKRHPIRLIVALPIVISLLFWLMVTNEYIAHRLYLIASGNDASVNARVFASLDKAFFILKETYYLGAAPGKTLDYINHYFQINLSIQNAYMEAFAATGVIGGFLFIVIMHWSFFVHPRFVLQLPLIMALLVSSVVFTPIYWLLAFYLCHVARAMAQTDQSTNLSQS